MYSFYMIEIDHVRTKNIIFILMDNTIQAIQSKIVEQTCDIYNLPILILVL